MTAKLTDRERWMRELSSPARCIDRQTFARRVRVCNDARLVTLKLPLAMQLFVFAS